MDEFGVLTERYGLKPQGKSAPMASSKRPTNNSQTGNFETNPKSSQFGSRSSANSNYSYNSFLDDHNGVFQSRGNKKTQHFGGLDDDIDIFDGLNKPAFRSNMGNGGSFDYDPIFMGSNKGVSTSSSSAAFVDDIFGGMPGLKTSASAKTDDGFSAFASLPKQSVFVDDLLDKIGGLQTKSKGPNSKMSEGFAKKGVDFDDLIPGFGVSNATNNGRAIPDMNKSHKPTVTSHDDPFLVFEAASSAASSKSFSDPLEQISKSSNSGGTRGSSSNVPPLRSPPKPATKVSSSNKDSSAGVFSIDELEEFAMDQVHNNASKKPNSHAGGKTQNAAAKTNKSKEAADSTRVNQSKGIDDLESIFGMGSRSSSVPKSRTTTLDHAFDGQMQHKGRYEVPKRVPSGSSASMKKSPVMTSFDDLSLIFDASPSSAFEEIEGETEERRKARLERHQRTQERAAKAVADMNQRDLQSKMEQEERRRIAETVDGEIKRWATGKEGNMRALLSSLQYVLWPECGWQPVSLTDMITSASVKKVYRKATLCIHPDKVQQKGANLEQKYKAEKVFDILKEASKKFNAEELS